MFEKLFEELKFQPQKYFKKGPRVYVLGGLYQVGEKTKKAVFKSPSSLDLGVVNFTNGKLHHEAIFLENAPSYLLPFIADIFRYGLFEGRFWYLIEWAQPGERMSLGKSDFLIKDKFFTQKNLEWDVETLAALRRNSASVYGALKKELSETFYDLADYRGLLEPQGKPYFTADILSKAAAFLDQAGPIYNKYNKKTVTHHEFYGSQIVSSSKTLMLTDWENVGWGHPLRDFMTMWIRAFEHPAWQANFLEAFKKSLAVPEEEFEALFGVEKILQNFGNIVHFSQTKLPSEVARKEKALAFFRGCVLETVS